MFIIENSENTDKLKAINFETSKLSYMKMNQCYQTLLYFISFQILLFEKVEGVESEIWRETETCFKIKTKSYLGLIL